MTQMPKIKRAIKYQQFLDDPNFPKSRRAFIARMFSNAFKSLKNLKPKDLILPISLALAYWLFNIYFLGFINDSCFFDKKTSHLAYLFSGVANFNVKGIADDMPTWPYVFTFTFSFVYLLKSIFRRMLKHGFLAPLLDFFRIFKLAKSYRESSLKPIYQLLFLPMAWAFIVGFLIVNPLTMITLAFILLLSFGMGAQSPLINLRFFYSVASELGRKKRRGQVLDGDVALPVLGWGIGFLLYFIISISLWFIFDYHFWARITVTCLFVIAFLFLGFGGRLKFKSSTTTALFVVLSALTILSLSIVFAHDGGWTESDKNFIEWLNNPGTQLTALMGIGGMSGILCAFMLNSYVGKIISLFTGELGAVLISALISGETDPFYLALAAFDGGFTSSFSDFANKLVDSMVENMSTPERPVTSTNGTDNFFGGHIRSHILHGSKNNTVSSGDVYNAENISHSTGQTNSGSVNSTHSQNDVPNTKSNDVSINDTNDTSTNVNDQNSSATSSETNNELENLDSSYNDNSTGNKPKKPTGTSVRSNKNENNEMPTICEKCGAICLPGQIYCANCGYRLPNSSEE